MKLEIKFSQEEDQYLLNNYQKTTSQKMSEYLKKPKHHIDIRLKQLGIVRAKKKTPNIWTDEQIKLLKDNYEKLSREKLSKLINQSENNIRTKLVELNLVTSNKRKSFKVSRDGKINTEEQFEYLKNNFDKLPFEEMMKHLNCSKKAIYSAAKKLNLSRNKKITKAALTVYEKEILIDNFDNKTLEELKFLLPNKTEKQILRNARDLGLCKRKQTIPEKLVENILYKQNISFEKEIKVNGSNYVNDFKVNNYIIEVQGDYWHGNPKFYKELNSIQQKMVNRDIKKKNELEKLGYKVIYIWEDDLKNNIQLCEDMIINTLLQ